MEAQLTKLGISPSAYLREARQKASTIGYTGTLNFSDKDEYKLMMEHNGKQIYFGRVGYNDFLIYSRLNKDIAENRRQRFWASHLKIKGKWKQNPYSPNWLALGILW